MTCPLCGRGGAGPYFDDRHRRYLECGGCRLVFVPPEYWPTSDREKARYDQHRNSPGDTGYRAFLQDAVLAVRPRVPPPANGLDFGSGPGPTLSVMLEEAGYAMALFDPYYAPDPSVLQRPYDFVTCTEVVEHLRAPAEVFPRLAALLRPAGWLVVMTRLLPARDDFPTWRYRRDDTHLCFYSESTFEHVARSLGCRLERAAPDVFALQVPSRRTASAEHGSISARRIPRP